MSADQLKQDRSRSSGPFQYYADHSAMSDPGRRRSLFARLPDDIRSLASIVADLGIYDVVAKDFYACDLGAARKSEIHIRSLEKRLDRIVELDGRPLSARREVDNRIAGRCNSFTLTLVGILRHKGIPARSRCGFGGYFNPPRYEDHWVCEYWNAEQRRWMLVDAQLDAVWRRKLRLSFDPCDVPRDQFLTAADAWQRYRRGVADPEKFGISFAGLFGRWFMASSVVRDFAALNKVETLPWDVWGAQPRPDATFDDHKLAYFDRLAALAADPDANFAGLRRHYEDDEPVRAPAAVFNALLQQQEAL
ncbi:MAG TPA: transglutaminase domain-containing protein [Xanthobacteraceae bacterium]|nr:transglutaminase domain-containing protein [Xanthobacteraceae bacterium]